MIDRCTPLVLAVKPLLLHRCCYKPFYFKIMTQEELITKQQIEIEDLKARLKENTTIKRKIKGMCFGIGAPLNDNILQMNKDQMKWCFQIAELGEQINGL